MPVQQSVIRKGSAVTCPCAWTSRTASVALTLLVIALFITVISLGIHFMYGYYAKKGFRVIVDTLDIESHLRPILTKQGDAACLTDRATVETHVYPMFRDVVWDIAWDIFASERYNPFTTRTRLKALVDDMRAVYTRHTSADKAYAVTLESTKALAEEVLVIILPRIIHAMAYQDIRGTVSDVIARTKDIPTPPEQPGASSSSSFANWFKDLTNVVKQAVPQSAKDAVDDAGEYLTETALNTLLTPKREARLKRRLIIPAVQKVISDKMSNVLVQMMILQPGLQHEIGVYIKYIEILRQHITPLRSDMIISKMVGVFSVFVVSVMVCMVMNDRLRTTEVTKETTTNPQAPPARST